MPSVRPISSLKPYLYFNPKRHTNMTQAQINQLMRPYLARQKQVRRKRELIKWSLSGMAALWVAVLLWLVFIFTFRP